jgi:ribosomal protein S28E/S33
MPVSELLSRAGGAALKQLQHLRLPGIGQSSVADDPRTAARRWRAVTVLTDPEQLRTTTPAPLAAFGDRLEVRVTAAPGDRGAELAARFRGPVTEDEIGELRSALRQAKQLAEVGEVLRVDPAPHGHRAATPQGAVLEGMTADAGKQGVL